MSSPSRDGEASLTINHPGGQRVLHYPNVGNTLKLLESILLGKEYPILQLPGYAPQVVVDVGANVGGSALFFALNFPGARVLCYEPSPGNVEYLRRNTRDLPRVEPFAYGLSDRTDNLKLYTGQVQTMQNSLFRSIETGAQYESVEVRKASDEFAARGLGNVSILKLDTEGCELAILTDLGPRLGDVDQIYLEYHSEDDRRQIDALLAPHFVLRHAHADWVHRGTLLYLSRAMVTRYPQLDVLKIDTRIE